MINENDIKNVKFTILLTKEQKNKIKIVSLYKNYTMQQTFQYILNNYIKQFEHDNPELFEKNKVFIVNKQRKLI